MQIRRRKCPRTPVIYYRDVPFCVHACGTSSVPVAFVVQKRLQATERNRLSTCRSACTRATGCLDERTKHFAGPVSDWTASYGVVDLAHSANI